MGAAAVLETAAETPPTVLLLVIVLFLMDFRALFGADARPPSSQWIESGRRGIEGVGERTHEVDDETRHAHEGLLALAATIVSMLRRRWLLLKLSDGALDLLNILGGGTNGGRHLVGGLGGYKMEWRGVGWRWWRNGLKTRREQLYERGEGRFSSARGLGAEESTTRTD